MFEASKKIGEEETTKLQLVLYTQQEKEGQGEGLSQGMVDNSGMPHKDELLTKDEGKAILVEEGEQENREGEKKIKLRIRIAKGKNRKRQ